VSAPQALGCAEDLVRSLKESMIDHAGCKVARLSRDESVMSNPVRTTSPGLDRSEREPGVRELSELRLPQVREIPPRWRPPFAYFGEKPGAPRLGTRTIIVEGRTRTSNTGTQALHGTYSGPIAPHSNSGRGSLSVGANHASTARESHKQRRLIW